MNNIQILIWSIFIITSIINSILDLKTMHISLIVNYIGFILTIIILIIGEKGYGLLENFISSCSLCLIFCIVRRLSHNGLGLGDIHYSLYCGFMSSIFVSILSALFASLLGIFTFVFIKIFMEERKPKFLKIPFIPFMFAGTILGNFLGSYII